MNSRLLLLVKLAAPADLGEAVGAGKTLTQYALQQAIKNRKGLGVLALGATLGVMGHRAYQKYRTLASLAEAYRQQGGTQ